MVGTAATCASWPTKWRGCGATAIDLSGSILCWARRTTALSPPACVQHCPMSTTSFLHITSTASLSWAVHWRRWTISGTPAAAPDPHRICCRCLPTARKRSDAMPTSLRTRDTTVHELLDGDALEAAALDRNLRDIRFINAVLGWRGYAVRAVARHVRSARLGSFSLVD